MSTILVTGARGYIGSRIVNKLVQAGARVRVLARQPSAALDRPSIEIVNGSYDDAPAVAAAMAGVSRALFITAGPDLARHDGVLATAAKAAGVEHVVRSPSWARAAAARRSPRGRPARTFRQWANENAATFQ